MPEFAEALPWVGGLIAGLLTAWTKEKLRAKSEQRAEAIDGAAEVRVAEIQDGAAMRGELWTEIGTLRGQLAALRRELNTERELNLTLRANLTSAETTISRLEDEVEELKRWRANGD